MRKLPIFFLLFAACAATPVYLNNSEEYSVNFPNKMIEIKDIDLDNVLPVVEKVDELVAAGEKTILFKIHSGGGQIGLGIALINHIEDLKKKEGLRVQCVVDWYAMSMAYTILQGVCDDRFMTKRAILLAHNGSGGAERYCRSNVRRRCYVKCSK